MIMKYSIEDPLNILSFFLAIPYSTSRCYELHI